jgi:hypothetical protein
MMILMFDREATDPAVPTWATPSQRAQGRSSKAAGLRVSGSCLTEPSTLASSFRSGTPLETLSATSAECPIYWWQNTFATQQPAPGSPEAVALGCTCSRIAKTAAAGVSGHPSA